MMWIGIGLGVAAAAVVVARVVVPFVGIMLYIRSKK